MKVVNSQLIFISSINRDNGDSNNFTVYFPKGLIQCSEKQKLRVTLADLVMKREFYAISVNNQNFQFTETDQNNANPLTHNIQLSRGFYSVYDLITLVQTAINTVSSYFVLTMTYNAFQNLFTFSLALSQAQSNFNNVATFNFNVNLSAYELLGFNQTSYTFSEASHVWTLSSVNGVSVSGTDSIYLRTSLLNEIPQVENISGVFQTSKILARVPIVVAPFNNIVYEDVANLFSIIPANKYIDQLNLMITDVNGNLINLNSEYSLTLKVDVLEEEKDWRFELRELNETMKLLLLSLHK